MEELLKRRRITKRRDPVSTWVQNTPNTDEPRSNIDFNTVLNYIGYNMIAPIYHLIHGTSEHIPQLTIT